MDNNSMANKREELYNLLGDLPARDRNVSAKTLTVEERENYILEKLILDLNGIEAVPAYFVKPKNCTEKTPTILFCHSHGGNYKLGKDELILGNVYMAAPDYASELTSRGYSALCIDSWIFGERSGRTESEVFKEMLWKGQVLWGMMVYDSLKALDYLETRPDVDTSRIAALGMSMGSTMSWWIAALDERIKVCVDICCLTDFKALIDSQGLDLHGVYYYVPSLLKHFTTAQINALIAPRTHFSLAGKHDPLTPADGLDRIDAELKNIYEKANATDAWKIERYDTGHFETPQMRKDVIEFLEEWLS